ncbi:hypothetical protein J7L48_03435 [bacterium]|nr:hypothetical protein [bacterium]
MKRSIIFFIVILQIIIFAQSIDWVSYPIDGFNAARGGAFLLYRNPSNLLYNPSTLVFSRQMGFSLSSGILAFGRKGISLGGYYKVYRGLTFFSGFMYNGVSGFEETLSDGSKTGSEFSVSRILGTGGFSFRFGRAPVSASIMFKYIYEDLYAASASGYGLKINVSGFTRFINFGVFMDNIVQVITWNDYEDKYPINFGVSLEKYIRKIGIAIVVQSDFDFNIAYRVGINYIVNKKLSLGAGTMNGNITMGAKYIYKNIGINYALQIEKRFLGINNMLSFSFLK